MSIPHMNTIVFLAGFLIALTAAALLLVHIIDTGVAVIIGVLGIGLIGASDLV